MTKSLTEFIVETCLILNKNNVQYLIVGDTAVAYHGYFRWSMDSSNIKSEKFDLDFWYNPTYNNYFNLLNAIEELGQDVSVFRNEKAPNPLKSYFKLDKELVTLDFLPKLKGLSKFSNSYDKKDIISINEVDLFFIDIDDLIEDKSKNSRPKDLIDIKHLQEIKKENK